MRKTERILIALVVIAICVWFLFPTIKWYGFVPAEDKALINATSLQVKEYSQEQARDVLDYLNQNSSSEVSKEYSFVLTLAKEQVKGKGSTDLRTCADVLTAFSASADEGQALMEAVEQYCRQRIQDLKELSSKALQLGLDLKGGMSILLDVDPSSLSERLGHEPSESEISTAIDEDIEILKNRIDQFGMAEPEIRRQGDSQILIELAGTPDPGRVDAFLKGKGSLAFHLADTLTTQRVMAYFEANTEEYEKIIDALANDLPFTQPSVIPQDRMLAGVFYTDEYGLEQLSSVVVIYRKAALDGGYLLSAQTSKDSTSNQPTVAVKLSDEGGSIFYDFTKGHIGQPLAIVMDGHVKSVATIRDALSTNVQISGFTAKEAENLAILLKTASLPISVTISSQQTVGASLGEDSVRIGMKAIFYGFLLVVLFMVVFYSWSGLIADVALVMNLVIMVATMGGFGSTLTLTGIAGLILSVGMAVDANVIIFERIKDELKAGTLPKKAVSTGFSKALWTILDSNITTIIAAVVLIFFGSSAVRGFATTLAIGIVSSLFTSLFLSHLLMDLTVGERISISWRRRYAVNEKN
ncbi:MAG: protein translocase subunit SecD [Sphaerochaetaceae bacterium]|nr:protein translocase subunit SecD [Sphaerochaetaceae bacterium]